MITCITCITSRLRAILFALHDASQINFRPLRAWFLRLDNSQLKLRRESFRPRITSTVLHGFIHCYIISSTDSNAVLLYSQLNGLLTTVGPHSIRHIHASLLVYGFQLTWLVSHKAAQYRLQVQAVTTNKKASLNPETYLYNYTCATGMPRVRTLMPPPF